MSNFIDFLLVISKLQSPIYRRSPQFDAGRGLANGRKMSSGTHIRKMESKRTQQI